MSTRAVILFAGNPRREARQKGLPARMLPILHRRIAAAVRSVEDTDLIVATGCDDVVELSGAHPATLHARTFGAKVAGVFAHAFRHGYRRVAILAGDVAGVTPSLVREALSGGDSAIGRSPDGGFYLLSVSSAPRIDWELLPWYSGAMCNAVAAALTASGERLRRLPDLSDVDSPAAAVRAMRALTDERLRALILSLLRKVSAVPAAVRLLATSLIRTIDLRGPPIAA
jgi:glycosyltransferase A (GT-A) superfamily protein (DUF2064 family)